jgi:hypothetical protein
MSADNAIAILRTHKNRGAGSYEYRLAEYGVSGEPFDRLRATSVSDAKGQGTVAMKTLMANRPASGQFDESEYAIAEETMVVVEGFVAIRYHCAQDFADMFANSPVFTNLADALAEAARMEDERYVEYGSERVCIDLTWSELQTQADIVRQRRLTCLVRGPNARAERIGNWNNRKDFKYLGGPGIEDKLKSWGWPDDVVRAAMVKVHLMYFDWTVFRGADNLRLAREGNAVEMERYAAAKAKGCCQSFDEVNVIDSEDDGEVHVHFGFNFGH